MKTAKKSKRRSGPKRGFRTKKATTGAGKKRLGGKRRGKKMKRFLREISGLKDEPSKKRVVPFERFPVTHRQ